MKKKFIVLIAIFIILLISKTAPIAQPLDLTPPVILHVPILKAPEQTDLVVEATVTDPESNIQNVMLFYRSKGSTEFQSLPMLKNDDLYAAIIPALHVHLVGLEYYLDAVNSSGKHATFPEINPLDYPTSITVFRPGTQVQQSPEIIIMSPEPGEVVSQSTVMIAASIFDPDQDVDLAAIKIFVDGVDYSARAQISAKLLTLNLPPPILPGPHQITITVKDKSGKTAPPASWEFIMKRKKAEKKNEWKMNGSLTTNLRYNDYNGSKAVNDAENKWDNDVSFNYSARYNWFKLDSYMFVTSHEDKLYQPRNRFLFDITARWIDLELGDVTPQYTPLTLTGRRLRGINSNLNFGFFKLKFSTGEVSRAVKEDRYSDNVTNIRNSLFARKVIAGRMEVGPQKYFTLGLSVVKTKDDTSSVNFQRQAYEVIAPGSRMDNLVASFDVGIHLPIIKSDASVEIAASVQNMDILARGLTAEEQQLVENDIEDATGRSISLEDIEQFIDVTTGMVVPNKSTAALDLNWQTKLRNHFFKINYRNVGRSYMCLPNSSVTRDYSGVNINTRSNFFKNHLVLNLGFRNFNDNLDDTQWTTTQATTAEGNLNYYSTSNLPNLNLGYRFYNQSDDNNLVDNLTNTITFGGNQSLNLLGNKTTIYTNIRLLTFENKIVMSADTLNNNYDNTSLTFSVQSGYSIPLKTTLSLGYNLTSRDDNSPDMKLLTLGLSANYRWMNEKLVTMFEIKNSSTNRNAESRINLAAVDNTRLNLNMGVRYYFKRDFNFAVKLGYSDFTNKVESTNNYSSTYFQFQLEKRF